MKPELGGIGHNPDAQPNPYSQIPDLVRDSLLRKPKAARLAERKLLTLVQNSEFFDPVIIAASYIQNAIVQPRQNARRIEGGVDLLEKVVLQRIGNNESSNGKKEIHIRIRPETVAAAKSLQKNDHLIKRIKFISQRLSYYDYVMGLASDIQKGNEQGKSQLDIVNVNKPKGNPSFSLEPFNLWHEDVSKLLLKLLDLPKRKDLSSRILDDLIDSLKKEPEQGLPERKKLYTRRYAEISLEDIEHMQYPVAKKDFDRIADFLLSALSDNTSLLHETDISALLTLFSHQTIFNDITGPIPIRNTNILAIINNWQENFADELLFGTNEERKTRVKDLIAQKAVNISQIMWDIHQHFRGNPDWGTAGNILPLDALLIHPVTHRYMKEFLERKPHQPVVRGKYIDELGKEYLEKTVIPLLRERLTELGLIDKTEEDVIFLEKYLEENPHSKTHLEAIRIVFEQNAGVYFLERLNEHTQEMEDITKAVWEEIYQKGIHFLPLSKGSEEIEFSSDSLPNLLGLKSIELRMSDSQKGEVLVSFRFLNNSDFVLLSTLDLGEEENMLSFKAPLKENNPGLYTILNLIETLAMRDLVTQEIDIREPKHDNLPAKTKWQELIEWLKDRFSKKPEKPKSTYDSLPRARTQKDQDVISSIHKDFPQRRVSLHTRALAGAEAYWNTVGEYIEALIKKDEERMPILEGKVEDARKKLNRIGKEKSANLPPLFRLETMEDPLTSEELYLETWVVEHTSPKPTEEELNSPVKLYERYYRNSSALAFLDQMKPWFVGQ